MESQIAFKLPTDRDYAPFYSAAWRVTELAVSLNNLAKLASWLEWTLGRLSGLLSVSMADISLNARGGLQS